MTKILYFLPLLLGAYFINTHISGDSFSIERALKNESMHLKKQLSDHQVGESLLPTIDSWMALEKLSESSGVKLTWLDETLYKGKHHSFSGLLEGSSRYVISVAGSIQARIPLVIHSIESTEGFTKLRLSVIGVNQ